MNSGTFSGDKRRRQSARPGCGEEQPYVALAETMMYQTAVLGNAVDAFGQAAVSLPYSRPIQATQ